jgi:hypothetical protein
MYRVDRAGMRSAFVSLAMHDTFDASPYLHTARDYPRDADLLDQLVASVGRLFDAWTRATMWEPNERERDPWGLWSRLQDRLYRLVDEVEQRVQGTYDLLPQVGDEHPELSPKMEKHELALHEARENIRAIAVRAMARQRLSSRDLTTLTTLIAELRANDRALCALVQDAYTTDLGVGD